VLVPVTDVSEQMCVLFAQKQRYRSGLYWGVAPSVEVYASEQVDVIYVVLIAVRRPQRES